MSHQSQHAPAAPSSLSRIVECHGSLKLSIPFEDKPPTEESIEGEAAHYFAMIAAQGTPLALGMVAPNGIKIDDEMIEGAALYVDALEGIPGTAERTVMIERIHPTQCWGTPDYFQYAANTKTLRIADYKYGHKYVEVWRNYQLMAYAAGVMDLLKLPDTEVILEFMIVQPRSFGHRDGLVRTWRTSATNIRADINIAFSAVADALGDKPTTKTSNECLHCPARANCATLAKVTASIVDQSGEADNVNMSPAQIGRELHLMNMAAARIDARVTGLQEQALALLKGGKVVPHFTLEESVPRQTWTAPPTEVLDSMAVLATPALASKVPQLLQPAKLITPKQAIKLGFDASVINAYSEQPRGKLKVVPDSTVNTQKVFAK